LSLGKNLSVDTAPGSFVLDMSERKLSQVDMQFVMSGVNKLVQSTVLKTFEELKVRLSSDGCNHSKVLDDILHKMNETDLFQGLHNQSNQIEYFTSKFGLVMPRKELLPVRTEDFGRFRAGQPQQFNQQNYIYVPIIPQLQHLLNIIDVYDEVKRPKPNMKGKWTCYEDGLNYQTNPLFQRHPQALQVHIYLDEVQMCCPLGSYSHKLVFVYFSIGNIPPKLRSACKFINLLSIFYYDQVSQYDYNTLLRPIIDDLKLLEDGVTFLINDKPEIMFGTLTANVADNLASHQVGGFKCGFATGFRKCRTCLAVDDDIQNKFSDCDHIARTKEDYERHCASMTVPELKDHFSKLYGLNHNSDFNTLKYYHVVGGLAPDIMHDLQEGVIPLIICLVLLVFLEKKYFNLDDLNHVIQNYDYGYAEVGNKPSIILLHHLKKIVSGSLPLKDGAS
jgi:hypothetical protein